MKSVVYILGAGFSAPLGLPTMAQFIPKAKDLLADIPERYGHFTRIFKSINDMAVVKLYMNQNLHNIEDILSILEMGEFVGKRSIRREYIQFIKDVIVHYTPKFPSSPQDILRPTSLNWPREWIGRLGYLSHYVVFVTNLLNCRFDRKLIDGNWAIEAKQPENPDIRYSIITLNYDTVIGDSIRYLDSWLSGPVQLKSFPIAKLHGSVDGAIIPPTWNKDVPKEIKASWRLAHEVLAGANEIRIMGYSLPSTDNHIRYLVSVGLKDCQNLKKLDIILRDAEGTSKRRYRELFDAFPNCRFRSANVEQYFEAVIAGESPPAEPFSRYLRNEGTGAQPSYTFGANTQALEEGHDKFMDTNEGGPQSIRIETRWADERSRRGGTGGR